YCRAMAMRPGRTSRPQVRPRDAPCPTTGNWPNHLHSRSWWSASSLRTSRRLTDESKTSGRDVLSNPIRLGQAVVTIAAHAQLVSPAYKGMVQSPAAVYADLIIPGKTGGSAGARKTRRWNFRDT